MKRDPVRATVLASKIIPNVSPGYGERTESGAGMKSLALITADSDDVTYTALDEATKKADVKVVYARVSMQALQMQIPNWQERSSEFWQVPTLQKSGADWKLRGHD